jgi:hypothetical protein
MEELVSVGVGRRISSPFEQFDLFSVVDFMNKLGLHASYRGTVA